MLLYKILTKNLVKVFIYYIFILVPTLFENEAQTNILKLPEPPIYKNGFNTNKSEYIFNFNEVQKLETCKYFFSL